MSGKIELQLIAFQPGVITIFYILLALKGWSSTVEFASELGFDLEIPTAY